MRKMKKGLYIGLCIAGLVFCGCGKKEESPAPKLEEYSNYDSVREKEIFIEDENLKTPKAMVCVGDSLYVVNKDGNSVLQYSKDGSLQNTIKGFWSPIAIAHFEKEIYVANENDGKIHAMDEEGNLLKEYYVEPLNQVNLSVLDMEADADYIYLSVVADNEEALSVYRVRKEDGQIGKIGKSCMGALCRDSKNQIYFVQTYEFFEENGYTGFGSGKSSLYRIVDGSMQEIAKLPASYTPMDMVEYGDKFYIYSSGLAQIDVLDMQGNYEKTVLEEIADSSNSGLGYMAADDEGNIYLSDTEKNFVYKLKQ